MARILVIDDERAIRDVLKRLFQLDGHVVVVAENGHAGLVQLRRQAVDLVVTDMTMPVKGGIETLAEVRRDFPAMKVIAMCGGWPGSALDPLMLAHDLGARREIRKPFEIEEMRRAAREVLAET